MNTTAGTEVAPERRDRPNTVQLGELEPAPVDWQAAANSIDMLDGNVLVAMEEAYEQASSTILVPDRVAGRLRPDTGTVLAVGAGVYAVQPGDRVVVLPYDGKHMAGFTAGSFTTDLRVRFLGCDSMNEYEHHHTHYTEIIPARLDRMADRTWTFTPIGHWVLIKRDTQHETSGGGIALPDALKWRNQTATVVKIGDRVPGSGRDVWPVPGDRVIYQGKALVVDIEFGERYGFVEDPAAYALIHVDDLHAIIP